jgi:hypothetical protein
MRMVLGSMECGKKQSPLAVVNLFHPSSLAENRCSAHAKCLV